MMLFCDGACRVRSGRRLCARGGEIEPMETESEWSERLAIILYNQFILSFC